MRPVLPLAALLLALLPLPAAAARPPAAYVEPGHVRLAVSSWCWTSRCGAPIAASGKPAVVARGSLVRIQLAFTPSRVRVAVGGTAVRVLRHGSQISWRATRGGGMTVNVTAGPGFVAYVGRLKLT
ncbi:MAG TPA: hypothetical protein VF488_00245 [Gemmatimonadaceae bacterium]